MEVTVKKCLKLGNNYTVYTHQNKQIVERNREGSVLEDYDLHTYSTLQNKYGFFTGCAIDGYTCDEIPEYNKYFSDILETGFEMCSSEKNISVNQSSHIYKLFSKSK